MLGPVVGLAAHPLRFLEQARERYGDIYTLDFGAAKVTMLNNPRHIQHVLVDRATNYRKGGQLWDSIRALLGNGLPVSEGDFWLRQRRMMQPHLAHEVFACKRQDRTSELDRSRAGTGVMMHVKAS